MACSPQWSTTHPTHTLIHNPAGAGVHKHRVQGVQPGSAHSSTMCQSSRYWDRLSESLSPDTLPGSLLQVAGARPSALQIGPQLWDSKKGCMPGCPRLPPCITKTHHCSTPGGTVACPCSQRALQRCQQARQAAHGLAPAAPASAVLAPAPWVHHLLHQQALCSPLPLGCTTWCQLADRSHGSTNNLQGAGAAVRIRLRAAKVIRDSTCVDRCSRCRAAQQSASGPCSGWQGLIACSCRRPCSPADTRQLRAPSRRAPATLEVGT